MSLIFQNRPYRIRAAPYTAARAFLAEPRMPEGSEERLSLRQADQVRGDLYAIHDDLHFIRGQLARQPPAGAHGHSAPGARWLGADRRADRAFTGFVTPISLLTRLEAVIDREP